MIDLMRDGKRTTVLVHRLVAKAFVPNEGQSQEVNHLDGDKLNNAARNLTWVTRAENMQHMVDVLKGHANRRQWRATSPTGEVFIFDNLTTFAAEHKLCRPHCVSVATGKRQHHKGWDFAHL